MKTLKKSLAAVIAAVMFLGLSLAAAPHQAQAQQHQPVMGVDYPYGHAQRVTGGNVIVVTPSAPPMCHYVQNQWGQQILICPAPQVVIVDGYGYRQAGHPCGRPGFMPCPGYPGQAGIILASGAVVLGLAAIIGAFGGFDHHRSGHRR